MFSRRASRRLHDSPNDRPQGRWRWSSLLGNEEPNMVLALAVYFAVTALRAGVL